MYGRGEGEGAGLWEEEERSSLLPPTSFPEIWVPGFVELYPDDSLYLVPDSYAVSLDRTVDDGLYVAQFAIGPPCMVYSPLCHD